MRWLRTDLRRLEADLWAERSPTPPPSWFLDAPDVPLLQDVTAVLGKWERRVHPASGGIDAIVYGDEWANVAASLREVVNTLDPGRSWRSAEVEQHAEPLVVYEEESVIGGIENVGPGGRLRVHRRTSAYLVEATARSRRRSLGGVWRHVEPIIAAVREVVGDDDVALRVAFGYHEASKWETQAVLRPAYVFLVEQIEMDPGPRWRLAVVQPATDVDGLPPEAGLENAVGHCG